MKVWKTVCNKTYGAMPCWTVAGSTRISGASTKINVGFERIEFAKNGRFKIYNDDKVIEGSFSFQPEEKSNLLLTYDELQLPPYPQEMLNNLSKEQIASQSYKSSVLNLFEVDQDYLTFYLIIPCYRTFPNVWFSTFIRSKGTLTHEQYE